MYTWNIAADIPPFTRNWPWPPLYPFPKLWSSPMLEKYLEVFSYVYTKACKVG